jgi:tellurite resistance protein TerC
VFNLLLWKYLTYTTSPTIANQKAMEFFTGYLIELSLSVDNMFIFIMIFSYFAIPAEYQRRVLLYGVLGAIIMRLVMILIGVILVTKFHWILYLFGLLLFITGIKMLIFANAKLDLQQSPVLRWMRKHLRITETLYEEKFILYQNKLLYVTPLLLVLVLIEMSDLIFALDSIPAIFAITEDPFIIFTSNIFAILGLRALYFFLANIAERFYFLKYGIALILIFIGFKMIIAYWLKIPIYAALGVVAAILIASIIISLSRTLNSP